MNDVGFDMSTTGYLQSFISTAEGRIFTANACRGSEIGLLGQEYIKTAINAVCSDADFSETMTFSAFLALVGKICRPGSPHSGLARGGLAYISGGHRITVIIASKFLELFMSTDDSNRFEIMTLENPSFHDDEWLEKLSRLDNRSRVFTLKPGVNFGQRWVWFTLTEKIARNLGYGFADSCRDILGLIHHKKDVHLTALHFPATLLHFVQNFRPTALEAGGNSRFSVYSDEPSIRTDDDFGRTVDLNQLQLPSWPAVGGPERISFPIPASAFRPGEVIAFDILGKLKLSRGETMIDDNHAFSKILVGSRSDDSLLQILI